MAVYVFGDPFAISTPPSDARTTLRRRFVVPLLHYRLDTSAASGGSSNRGGASRTARLHLILNWFEELKAKVPTK
jgi:hypothetical protein